MLEGSSIEEYLRNARDLKKRLAALGQSVEDCTLVELVLNGLPKSYEGVIHTVSMAPTLLTSVHLSAKLLVEVHHMELQNKQMGDEEALMQFNTIDF